MLPCGAPCTSLVLKRSLLPEKEGSSGLMLITGWRAIQKLINQHIHIFPGKLCSAFSERPGAWFPLPSFLPGRLSWAPLLPSYPPPRPQVSACQAAPVRTLEDRSRVPGGQAGGRWGGSDVRERREARPYRGRGPAEPTQTPGHVLCCPSQPACCPLHCLSLLPLFLLRFFFCPVQHKIQVFMCSSCLWSKCSFWSCLVKQIVKVTKESQHFRSL